MAAPVVYDDVAEGANLAGQLFSGKKFWVAQRVPSRNRYLDLIRSNGGEVVMLEKKADYLIADHFRRDCPPGSISYTFIEKSIEHGEIQDPDQHRAGPPVGVVREAGSASRPTKGGRAAYTAEEDRILYKWVRDAEAQGGLVAGNEIYKQLQEKHPRHTWQSWRDRYLKQLRDRPPSAFNIPDNAPPSPPTDEPTEPAAAPTKAKQPAAKTAEPSTSRKVGGLSKARAKEDYTVHDFNTMFDKENWEELYAFVEEINSCTGERYLNAWKSWAEGKTQTAEQWKQYFEKVIRPQWEQDPVSKREKIRKMVEKRQEEEAIQKASQISVEGEEAPGPATPRIFSPKVQRKRDDPEDACFEKYLTERQKGKAPTAYVFYAREKKWSVWNEQPGLDYTELHALLMSQWDSLSAEDRAPYFALEAAEKGRTETARKSPQVCPSSSTAVHETPHYITKAYEKALKRIHEGDKEIEEQEEEQVETPRPSKRRKSENLSPAPEDGLEQAPIPGTQQQPVEISSTESSSSESQLPQDEDMEDAIQPQSHPQESAEADKDAESLDSVDLGTDDLAPIPPPNGDIEPLASSDYPSNTPTPRAPRHKAPAFDTQAILSSPSQGFSLTALPRPEGFTQYAEAEDEACNQTPLLEPSSPAHKSESEASTTHSLQEFRRSLDEPLPPPERSSPAPSSPSSTSSGDPDPPLTPSEFDVFFEEQHDEGFADELITEALKHTRCRPELAMNILVAWKKDKPLPNQRGVWSKSDDEDVESGDGRALARLERKHTCDGWGGITERLRFLEQYRSRGQGS